MYRLTVYIMIIYRCTYLFTAKIRRERRDYIFLRDATEFLRLLKIECTSGKTYPRIFANAENSFFADMDFDNKQARFSKLNIDEKIKEEMYDFLNSIGKKDTRGEKEYIQQKTDYFQYKADRLKESYDKKYKRVYLSALSIGLIIVVIII